MDLSRCFALEDLGEAGVRGKSGYFLLNSTRVVYDYSLIKDQIEAEGGTQVLVSDDNGSNSISFAQFREITSYKGKTKLPFKF